MVPFGSWGVTASGSEVLHYVEVRRWDVRRCELLGRRVVRFRGGLLPRISHPEYTFEFDVRDAETGRPLPAALSSPDPQTHIYPHELPGRWTGDNPGDERHCRVSPDGEATYLRAESVGRILAMLFLTLVSAAMVLVGALSVWKGLFSGEKDA